MMANTLPSVPVSLTLGFIVWDASQYADSIIPGKIYIMKEIQLTQGKVALVDDEDYEELSKYRWVSYKRKHNGLYHAGRKIYKNGDVTTIWMHREIMCPPVGLEIDHKDGNGLNNQRSNLRFATKIQNQQNRRKAGYRNGKPTASKYKGVWFRAGRGTWAAEIRINKKKKYLGAYNSEAVAAKIYNDAATKYFGEFACLNEITDEGEGTVE